MGGLTAPVEGVRAAPNRYRLSRAGVLNVWQYDSQVFEFADGRMLLRGANGAGKSKTLEMLLPFVLDGDKRNLTASGRHHTSLIWLMLENGAYDEKARVGYVWVEFVRPAEDGEQAVLTCGIGIRASQATKSATSWYFTCPAAVGDRLLLEDGAGPLTQERCRSAVDALGGAFFDRPRPYKEHVGRLLFGLEPPRYDELLKLLYWLRQPQVGEDIEPGRLAQILTVALPELDERAVRSAGDSLDQLADFGEQVDRLQRTAAALSDFCGIYRRYAAGMVRERAVTVLDTHREHSALARTVQRYERDLADTEARLADAERDLEEATRRAAQAEASLQQLEASPEARSQAVLTEKGRRAEDLGRAASTTEATAYRERRQAAKARSQLDADTKEIHSQLGSIVQTARSLAAGLDQARVARAIPVPPLDAPLVERADAERTVHALAAHMEAIAAVRPALGAALAAVKVVEDALAAAEQAERDRDRAEDRASHAEQQAEAAEQQLRDVREKATALEVAFADALRTWQSDARGAQITVEEPWTAALLTDLPRIARSAAAPALDAARNAKSDAQALATTARDALADLRERRQRVEAERDPAPQPPSLPRSPRDRAAGAPLWLLVDFTPAAHGPRDRALVEAALEASGLLDAWVRADGAVLDAGQHDAVLPLGPPVAGPSLADVLAPASADLPVRAEIVTGVLRRIALVPDAVRADAAAALGVDGSWRLGTMVGRTTKPVAQYVGASARVAERSRRLAAIDAEIGEVERWLADATAEMQAAAARVEELEAWLSDLPSPRTLLDTWVAVDERIKDRDRLAAEAVRLRGEAAALRRQAAAARRRVDQVADAEGLPANRTGLAVRREELRSLGDRLDQHRTSCTRLDYPLRRWLSSIEDVEQLERSTNERAIAASDARRDYDAALAAYTTLRETVGAAVRELEERLHATRTTLAAAKQDAGAARDGLNALLEARGSRRASVEDAQAALVGHIPAVTAAVTAFAELPAVPGLVLAALERELTSDEVAAFATARGGADDVATPRAVLELARAMSDLDAGQAVDQHALYRAHQALLAGPAAETEPRIIPENDALAVLARDEGGEHPVAVLARRLTLRVAEDRALFTQREAQTFEKHLLAGLGDGLRACQLEAAELVSAMNRLLDGVRTSQGITLRLGWRLKDDAPPEAKAAAGLLSKPHGALLPDERQQLKEALHQLIETSRAESPEEDYAYHLARALDYRTWSEFRVRISRPEAPGEWQVLTRRTPLSQGEQKVVCYLPLFAAAAAHFTAVAGAAPEAPRFVLLDDAFPKIDINTHPKLFGLLVALDLDFIVTSERLWGDCPTLPSLAIYEALRSPTERGIAQFKHVWDGRRLQAVGA